MQFIPGEEIHAPAQGVSLPPRLGRQTLSIDGEAAFKFRSERAASSVASRNLITGCSIGAVNSSHFVVPVAISKTGHMACLLFAREFAGRKLSMALNSDLNIFPVLGASMFYGTENRISSYIRRVDLCATVLIENATGLDVLEKKQPVAPDWAYSRTVAKLYSTVALVAGAPSKMYETTTVYTADSVCEFGSFLPVAQYRTKDGIMMQSPLFGVDTIRLDGREYRFYNAKAKKFYDTVMEYQRLYIEKPNVLSEHVTVKDNMQCCEHTIGAGWFTVALYNSYYSDASTFVCPVCGKPTRVNRTVGTLGEDAVLARRKYATFLLRPTPHAALLEKELSAGMKDLHSVSDLYDIRKEVAQEVFKA